MQESSTENQEIRNLLLEGERRGSLSDPPHSQVADVLIQEGETVVTLSKKGTFTLLHDEGDNDSPAITHNSQASVRTMVQSTTIGFSLHLLT